MLAPKKYDFGLLCIVSELVPTSSFNRYLYQFSNILEVNVGPVSRRWQSVDIGCIADVSEILTSLPPNPMALVDTD
jgi:hypothetical protein